jgi:hypothetical protein
VPWYWSDDIAANLISAGKLDPSSVSGLVATPVAFRRDHDTIEEAIEALLADDEIPLAA